MKTSVVSAAAVAAFALAALTAMPAAAIDSCAGGTGVVTPDGASGTVIGAEGALCQVQDETGVLSLIAPEMLMADFGAVQPVAAPPAAPEADLVTGYYLCGEEATGFEVELSEEGSYAQDGAGAGSYSVAEGQVSFADGPLAGRVLPVVGGLLAVPGAAGGAPVACELIEE
ncbi:hypothetical protein [Frigidibacter sp. MR17.24]|uniref:hypothetical protein n=1 Tax=Frigidibacter sp. MR17.24 TaxID=3127345 RepID=UPI00301301E3